MVHHVKEHRIKKLLNRKKHEEVMFHHRYSTSTIDVRNACHPFSTKDYFESQYVGMHNGVLNNSKTLKTDHLKRGIQYVSTQENGTFNDSEALVYDLARYFEGEVDRLTASGTIAFIVIKMVNGKRDTLFFGHNSGNPLVMKKTNNSITISSTGEGEPVPINKLHMYNYETGKLRVTDMTIPSYSSNWYGGSKNYSASTSSYTQQTYLPKSTTGLQMVEGDKDTIIRDFFLKYDGNLSKAADIAWKYSKDAEAEAKVVNRRMMNAKTPQNDVDKLVDRAMELHEYQSKMEEVAAELYMLADEQEQTLRDGSTSWKNPMNVH